ncbi:MAG: pilus assembly protein [Thiotrichales bacterium]|nr:pilus assembly protein [Thiotrichales bacterium]
MIRQSSGQALVEYAIILMLMVLLIAGGTELGIASFNSNRTSEGAKTGATDWLETALVYNVVYDSGLPATTGGFRIEGGTGLGDHETLAGFDMPICDTGAGGPDNGLPLDGNIYLFNPKLIDITDCTQDEINNLFDILPPVHNSIRSLYTEQCVTDNAGTLEWVPLSDCNTAAGDLHIMKLTGALDGIDEVTEINVYDENHNFVTTLPQFELECEATSGAGFGPCDTDDLLHPTDPPADVCWSDEATPQPLACNVRMIVRHRHLFESFVIFQDWKSPVPLANLGDFDQGPGGFGNVGSELWRGRVRKAQRTFKGCYETNFLTNIFNVAGGVYGNIISADMTSCN